MSRNLMIPLNRNLTNCIRWILDECLPPIIRDNKFFMFPFYYWAYRGKNINTIMYYKKLVYGFSPDEYKKFYENLDSLSRHRLTDLNHKSITIILSELRSKTRTLLDVGCGSGYLLDQIAKYRPQIKLAGADICSPFQSSKYEYYQEDIQSLSFDDCSFDVVTCCHTLEHILKVENAVKELQRICREKLIIVVPCQRYYFYTLDEHLNFFTRAEQLTALLESGQFQLEKCQKVRGDWVVVLRRV